LDPEGDGEGALADEGVLDWKGLSWIGFDPVDPRWDLDGSDVCGVNSAALGVDDAADSLLWAIGRKRSLLRSNISEPIALMALEYRSLRIRDSLTKNSANSRTLSASSAACASFSAKSWKRPMLPRENCSTDWLMTVWRVSGLDGDSGAG
jgi:hypothetical protein